MIDKIRERVTIIVLRTVDREKDQNNLQQMITEESQRIIQTMMYEVSLIMSNSFEERKKIYSLLKEKIYGSDEE